jgi:hypothetical protein
MMHPHQMMGMPQMAVPHPMPPVAQAIHLAPRMATPALTHTPRSAINQLGQLRSNLIAQQSKARQALVRRQVDRLLYPISAAYAGHALNPYAFSNSAAPTLGTATPASGYAGGSGGYSGGAGGFPGGSGGYAGGSGNYGMNPYGPGPYGTNPYGLDPYGYSAYPIPLSQGSSAAPVGQTDQSGQPDSSSGQGSKTAK